MGLLRAEAKLATCQGNRLWLEKYKNTTKLVARGNWNSWRTTSKRRGQRDCSTVQTLTQRYNWNWGGNCHWDKTASTPCYNWAIQSIIAMWNNVKSDCEESRNKANKNKKWYWRTRSKNSHLSVCILSKLVSNWELRNFQTCRRDDRYLLLCILEHKRWLNFF